MPNLRFDVEAHGDASELATMAAQARALDQQLDRLDNRRVKVKVQLTGASAAELARVAAVDTALAGIDGRTARARVEITGTPGPAEVRQLRAAAKALRELDGQNATATVSVTGNMPDPKELRAAARALKQLQDASPVNVHITVTGAAHELAAIIALGRALRNLPNSTTANVRTNVDASVLGRISTLTKLLAGVGAAGGVAAAGLIGTTAAALSLGGSLVSLVGLAPLFVGALWAGAAAGAALKVGLSGVADVLKESDPKKFAEGLKKLAPAAQEFVKATREIGPAWREVKLDTQQKLFAGLGAEVKKLSGAYLPSMKQNLGGIATGFNGMAKDLVSFATQADTVRDVNQIFRDTGRAVEASRGGVVNLTAAFTDIAAVGTSMLPELAAGWSVSTGKFREFIAEARETGKLEGWIRGGLDALDKLTNIAGNVGGSLGAMFKAAKASGADFLTTADRITAGVERFLKSTEGQTALVDMFTEARRVIDELEPGLAAAGRGVMDMIQSFSNTGGLNDFAATVSNLLIKLEPLGAVLGKLAGDTLGALAGGAQLAGNALSPLVGVIGGVSDATGSLGGHALAAVVAWKVLGAATPLFTKMSAAAARAAQSLAFMSYGSSALAGAAGAGSAAVSRLATGLMVAGRALPYVGVALIALAPMFEDTGSKAKELAKTVIEGSSTMGQAVSEETKKISDSLRVGALAYDDNARNAIANSLAQKTVQKAYEEQYNALSASQKLQVDYNRAQRAQIDAVAQFGETSQEAADASAKLAEAKRRLEAAERGAAEASKTHNEVLAEQVAAAQGALGANLTLAQALRDVAAAEKIANDAVRRHGAGSAEAATALDQYVIAANNAAVAAGNKAKADADARGATNGAELGTRAYAATLLTLAANASGPARGALLDHLSKLDQAQLNALSAAAATTGFATKVLELPNGKRVLIAVDPETGKIVSTQQLLDTMAKPRTVPFTGVPIVDVAVGTLNAVAVARDAVITGVALVAGAQTALDTTAGPRNSPVTAVPNTGAATGALDIAARARTSTVTAVAQIQAAVAAINSLQRNTFSTHTVNVRVIGGSIANSVSGAAAAIQRAVGGATGGIAVPMARGGIVGYATGGIRPLTPMRGGIARMVPPNTWRVVGDNMRSPEAYIPINGSARSRDILAETMQRMGVGMGLAGLMRGTQTPGVASPDLRQVLAGTIAARVSAAAGPRGRGSTTIVAPPDLGPVVARLAQLEQTIRAGLAAARPITVEDRSGNPVETARATQLALRR